MGERMEERREGSGEEREEGSGGERVNAEE